MNAATPRAAGASRRTPSLEWLWRMAGGVSVRTKILGIVLTLTIVLGLGITWQVRDVMSRTLLTELQERGYSVTSDLAARSLDPILLNDTFALHELLKETLANHSDVIYAFVVDTQGQVLAHTFDDGFPIGLRDLNKPSDETAIRQIQYRSDQGIIHDFAAPIFNGSAGFVRFGVSEARLEQTTSIITSQMLLTTLLVAIAGIAAAILLTWLLTRPILQLVETTRQVGQGNLAARAPRWADDEIGDLADAFNQMVAELQLGQNAVADKEAARGRLLAQLISAQEEERRRIARELHDGVGQSLASVLVGLKLVNQHQNNSKLATNIEDLRQITGDTLDDVRLLSRQLHPSVLDDLGLAAALQRFTSDLSGRYLTYTIDLHIDLPERLPETVEITLYRVVQEAITNAVRHSQGNAISVLLNWRQQRVQAIVEDNGLGFDAATAQRAGKSVGLHSMTERVELLGGALQIESSVEGTTVFVEVPIQ